jgi:hypothetical protein
MSIHIQGNARDSKNQHYFGIFPRFPPIVGISRAFALFLHPFCE